MYRIGVDTGGTFTDTVILAPGGRVGVGKALSTKHDLSQGILDSIDRAASTLGLSGTMRRVGFQAHDGRIFEVLAARGGDLVAIRTEPRAADALAILHSYGGGNAAIGAWTGRV